MEPLPLNSFVVLGDMLHQIRAVGITGGERYYWLTDEHGTVSMLPAIVVEARAEPR